jgi:hypothetical protein
VTKINLTILASYDEQMDNCSLLILLGVIPDPVIFKFTMRSEPVFFVIRNLIFYGKKTEELNFVFNDKTVFYLAKKSCP